MKNDHVTVYTTETGRICPSCGKPIKDCVCKKTIAPKSDGIVRIQRESKGRKGKTVTLVRGIPLTEDDIHQLLSELKRLCGSGGSYKDGIIEIQGDHREILSHELHKRGYKIKLVGG